MTTTIKRTLVLEHVEETTSYIADDGTEFPSESACVEYEKRQSYFRQVSEHPVFKYSCTVWPEDLSTKIYFIFSDADYIFLTEHLGVKHWLNNDYEKFGGPDFYLYFYEDCGDDGEEHSLFNLARYMLLLRMKHDNWEQDMYKSTAYILEERRKAGLPCIQ